MRGTDRTIVLAFLEWKWGKLACGWHEPLTSLKLKVLGRQWCGLLHVLEAGSSGGKGFWIAYLQVGKAWRLLEVCLSPGERCYEFSFE